MRFLVDECAGPQVAEWLRGQGHEVFSVFAEARGADDDSIIGKANAEGWILITNDRDFGEKVFRDDARTAASFLCASKTNESPARLESSVA